MLSAQRFVAHKLLSRVVLRSTPCALLSSVESEDVSSRANPVPPFHIPRRVYRDEYTVLRALASTVQRRVPPNNLALPDDPWFNSSHLLYQRLAARGKAAGRRAAKWLVNKKPQDILAFATEEPQIGNLLPKWTPEEVAARKNVSEEDVNLLVDLRAPELAWQVFEKLQSAGGAEFQDATYLRLLDSLCYHNSSNPEDLHAEEYLFDDRVPETIEWREEAAADGLWCILPEELQNSRPALISIIRGMAKTRNTKCLEYYKQLKKVGFVADLDTFNLLLACFVRMPGLKWSDVSDILKDMAESKVAPNGRTFANALRALSHCKFDGNDAAQKYKIGLSLLRECLHLEINPPLVFWGIFIVMVDCAPDGPGEPPRGMLPGILEQVERQLSLPQQVDEETEDDCKFWECASSAILRYYNSPTLVRQLDKLRYSTDGRRTAGVVIRQRRVNRDIFQVLMKNSSIEDVVDYLWQVQYNFGLVGFNDKLLGEILKKVIQQKAFSCMPTLLLLYTNKVDYMPEVGSQVAMLLKAMSDRDTKWENQPQFSRRIHIALAHMLNCMSIHDYSKYLEKRNARGGIARRRFQNYYIRFNYSSSNNLVHLASRIGGLQLAESFLERLIENEWCTPIPFCGVLHVSKLILSGREPSRALTYLNLLDPSDNKLLEFSGREVITSIKINFLVNEILQRLESVNLFAAQKSFKTFLSLAEERARQADAERTLQQNRAKRTRHTRPGKRRRTGSDPDGVTN